MRRADSLEQQLAGSRARSQRFERSRGVAGLGADDSDARALRDRVPMAMIAAGTWEPFETRNDGDDRDVNAHYAEDMTDDETEPQRSTPGPENPDLAFSVGAVGVSTTVVEASYRRCAAENRPRQPGA